MKSRDKREVFVMVPVTSYKWTPVMHSCNKFRELFLCSVMLFDGQTTQENITGKTPESTKTALHCDFLGRMAHPFLPSCTLSNLNRNKITGVESALCSANKFHKLPGVVAWSDTSVWSDNMSWHCAATGEERKEVFLEEKL